MLQGFGSPPVSGGVPLQPERLQPSCVAQRVLQVEQPGFEPASLVRGGEQAGVRYGLQGRRVPRERDVVAREGPAGVISAQKARRRVLPCLAPCGRCEVIG